MVEQTGNEQSSQDKGSLQITRSFFVLIFKLYVIIIKRFYANSIH